MTEESVQQFVPHPLALYSIAMPGNIETVSIMFTTRDPVCSYYETIELDHVAEACVTYLIEAGALVLRDSQTRRAYLAALEAELRAGTMPEEARDNASRDAGLLD